MSVPNRVALAGWCAMARQDAEAWTRIAKHYESLSSLSKDPKERAVLARMGALYLAKAARYEEEARAWDEVIRLVRAIETF